MTFNLLNDDTYQDRLCQQVEQGVHEILIYSTKKVFLERAVVELVYKFDKKSHGECLKK